MLIRKRSLRSGPFYTDHRIDQDFWQGAGYKKDKLAMQDI